MKKFLFLSCSFEIIFITFVQFYFLFFRICYNTCERYSSFTISFLIRVTSIRLSTKTRRSKNRIAERISESRLTRYHCHGDGRSRAIEKSRIALEMVNWRASGNGPNTYSDSVQPGWHAKLGLRLINSWFTLC